jgi:hypothetical protein
MPTTYLEDFLPIGLASRNKVADFNAFRIMDISHSSLLDSLSTTWRSIISHLINFIIAPEHDYLLIIIKLIGKRVHNFLGKPGIKKNPCPYLTYSPYPSRLIDPIASFSFDRGFNKSLIMHS